MELDPAKRREEVRARLAENEPREAFRLLDPLLAFPRTFEAEGEDVELFAEVSQALGAQILIDHLVRVQGDASDVDALYDLGYELIEHDLSAFAASVLERARSLEPSNSRVLTELVAALERDMRHEEAATVLRGAPGLVESDFLCAYLLAFNSLLSGETREARRLLPGLLSEADERYDGMAERVNGMLARWDALQGVRPLDRDDLLGWHFVISGGVLLHRADVGLEVMRGRYAWLQDDVGRCLEGLQKLQQILSACDRMPPRVFALPDPHGPVLAEAAAQLLDVPLQDWPEAGSESPGLLVAYDLSDVGKALRPALQHREGQVLFAQATNWTRDFPLAADFTTLLYQFNVSPWERPADDDGAPKADPRALPLEERARGILRAQPTSAGDVAELLALLKVSESLPGTGAAGLWRTSGQRARHWAGSPVKSNRFV